MFIFTGKLAEIVGPRGDTRFSAELTYTFLSVIGRDWPQNQQMCKILFVVMISVEKVFFILAATKMIPDALGQVFTMLSTRVMRSLSSE